MMDQIQKILRYRQRDDIARLLKDSYYEIQQSTTYGTYLFSYLSTVEIYSPLHLHEKLVALSDADRDVIFQAFLTMHPPKDHSIEICSVNFYVNPNAEFPPELSRSRSLSQIDFEYIQEQIEKCDDKLSSGDYDGAITNARTLLENICLYILEQMNEDSKYDGNLPKLYKRAAKSLNMDPSDHSEQFFKEILSGCISVVNGLANIRNELSDAHGKASKRYYKPAKRHAAFVVEVSKAVSEFLYSSYLART